MISWPDHYFPGSPTGYRGARHRSSGRIKSSPWHRKLCDRVQSLEGGGRPGCSILYLGHTSRGPDFRLSLAGAPGHSSHWNRKRGMGIVSRHGCPHLHPRCDFRLIPRAPQGSRGICTSVSRALRRARVFFLRTCCRSARRSALSRIFTCFIWHERQKQTETSRDGGISRQALGIRLPSAIW